MERIVLESNGFRFDALATGPLDGELVLCLHGFPQFADAWTAVLTALGEAGYRAVAFDQRGYSPQARPPAVADYAMPHLVADVIGIADALGAPRFHLIGHDWGGAVAWATAGAHAHRLATLTILSTPHSSALTDAIRTDADQQARSAYMLLFRAEEGVAEKWLLGDDAAKLRGVYQGKVTPDQVEAIVARLSAPGAATAALNWYRAMADNPPVGTIIVPTLFVWGDEDQALGRVAALGTARHVEGPYRFEALAGRSHWLIDECPETITALLMPHLAARR